MNHSEGGGGSRSAHRHTGGRNGCRTISRCPLPGYACPVSNRVIRPFSSTVKSHRVRISPQVSLR
ncbi:hypothetical protein RKD48_005615 [Streptomyces ambofaciens]